MFCRRMAGYAENDQLLIHCFQDSLARSVAKWYNQLTRAQVNSWEDLAQAFTKQYGHVTDIALDRITLQNIEKKPNEDFRQYAQRWREVATQVQPPLSEKETVKLFISTLRAPFITHMVGSTTQSFTDIVLAGEMIENAIRGGRIEAGEATRRSVPRKKDNEVNNMSTYSKGYPKAVTVNSPKVMAVKQQGTTGQEPGPRPNFERPQFTPISITYGEMYRRLFDAHIVAPYYLKPLQPPFPKWYNPNAECEYHAGITGHSIENCTAFKKVVEKFIKMGIIELDDLPGSGNPLPNHGDGAVNMIGKDRARKTKEDISDVRTPLIIVWGEMVKRGLIKSSLEGRSEKPGNYCAFHGAEGHKIQDCTEFRLLVQGFMDNKELEFYEENSEEGDIHATEGELTRQKAKLPKIIISRPSNSGSKAQAIPKIIIKKPASFPYEEDKKVPWSYNCNVATPGVGGSTSTENENQKEGFHTRSGKRYDPTGVRINLAKSKAMTVEPEEEPSTLINVPVREEEAKEFLKFLKHSEYSVVEQLHKQPARISVLALLLSSEVHRKALMKVLNETYVTKDISVSKLDRLIGNISADNFISFSDDEIPSGGMGSTKALHITTHCKGSILPSVLIDNGSALNVLPLSTLKRLPIDRAVPSSLHQKLKLVADGRLVTINAEEDIIATVTNDAPYVEANEEAVECSFRSLEFVNATFVREGAKIPVPKISKTTRMGLQMMISKGALPGRGLGRCLQGEVQVPSPKGKRDRFGLGFKPNTNEMRREMEKKQERRRARLKGEETMWEPMTFPHISQTFVSGGIIHFERGLPNEGPHINAIDEGETGPRNLSGIRPYELGSILNNWTAEELPVAHFEQDMCLEGPQEFEGDRDGDLSPDLLRMVQQEEKQILPHDEEVENVSLEEGKMVRIGARITEETKQNLVELLREFKDVFAWSYQDMPGLSTDIVVHRLPIKEECKLVQQKLRRMRPDVVLKIKEEVKKQYDAGFLQVVKYSEWVANIVPVPKKDGKIKMHPEDMAKTTFITLWGTFCYKVMPFGLKNAGATYQRAMVALFHDMMHKEIEVYVDDMIAKSRTEKEHVEVLKKLFLRLRRFQLKLNPTKCTFGARSGKLLGFVVSEKGIEVDSDKVKAIQDLPPPRTQKEVRGFLGRPNYIARFISQLTEKCDPIFRLLKKHNQGIWNEECQRAFDKVKQYLSTAPVLSLPNPDRPLILYLSVFDNSMGCVLGQHDESGRKEKAIYYLSKKFTECEMRYSSIEKLCCALIWATRRLRQYMLYHTTWLISKLDPLKYMMESTALNGRMARWQILLSEFDIVYVNQKAIKGSVIVEFLASRASEDYEPLSFEFPNEELMYVANTKEIPWKLNFDGASNAVGNEIGAILVSPNGDHHPLTCRLDFDCTNNMAEYEACIMGIRAAIEQKIRVLEVYGDSALVIYQLKNEWETRDPKLIKYRKIVLELIEEFDDVTFYYLPRDENQMADALATLASMIKVNRPEDMRPIQMSILEAPAYCCNLEDEERDDRPWYQNVLQYIKNGEYPEYATENEKRTLRRLASDYVLDGNILYKKGKDQVLLRCVDAVEAKQILEEVHEGICGTHANGFTMARQIMRFGYYWSTMEGDCIKYARKCHKFSKFLKKEIICRYGMPERIISDNALNLNNSTIADVCSQFGIKHHNSSPYRPKMNGAVEAANKNIKKIIGKMTETYKDWHEKLPFALYAYRTSVRTSTGATPFSLVYGMEAVLPIEVEIPSLRVLSEIKLDEAEWIRAQYDQLNLIEEKRLRAIRHGQMYQKRMMRAYDKRIRPREFKEGDLVLKKILPIQKDFRGKWMPNWEGPYVVKEAFSGGALILIEMDGKSLPNPVNSDSVKKYYA
ncbi:gag/pol polyprotein [Gossypium australe]|uniref:Gag/pol polyprotein n=1 Tax=Gossypium australe TaxID=47621 RepID=A0A5B6UPT1_9ROSI|nr:gag/pol polyprotein [Gossypium australe]